MKRNIHITWVLLLMLTAGCKKDVLELQNQGAYTYDTYFATNEAINQATVAAYSTLLHTGLYSRDYYFILDLLGNDAERDAPLLGDLLQLAQYNFGANNNQLQDLWGSLYRMVYRTNVVIDRANAWNPTKAEEQALKRRYIAEAKFLKAWANFNLVSLWGRVPLRKDYQSSLNNNYPSRAPVAEVWAEVEKDLTEAAADLPIAYDAENLGRATRGAAVALLGKAFLYQKKYQQAQTEFQKLIQAPYNYSLVPNYDRLFSTSNQSNPETIFQVMHGAWTDWGVGNQYYMFGGQEAWGGRATHTGRAQEYGFLDWRNVYVSNAIVQSFRYPHPTTGTTYTDPRGAFTFYGDAASGGDVDYCNTCPGGPKPFPFAASNGGYRWRKYGYYEQQEAYGGPQSAINTQVIRYADVLLMFAETYIQQGNTGNAPLQLINQVRQRVGAPAYPSLGSQQEAIAKLMRERRLELSGEQVRFFDLIRWGIAKETINAEKGAPVFQDRNVLLPIPQREKDTNPNVANDIANGWN